MIFFHIAAILGLFFVVRLSFSTSSWASSAFVAGFLARLDAIDKLAVLVCIIAHSCCVPMGKAWHVAVFIIRHEPLGQRLEL
jgi:hypothetical protein